MTESTPKKEKIGFNWSWVVLGALAVFLIGIGIWAEYSNSYIKKTNAEALTSGKYHVLACDDFQEIDLNVIKAKTNDHRIDYFYTPDSCPCDPTANYPMTLVYHFSRISLGKFCNYSLFNE
jgi:hypothetical protein